MDEKFLFWKHMSVKNFLCEEAKSMAGFKSFKNSAAVLTEGNVAGYKLKPFVIWHMKTPGPSSLLISKQCQCATQVIRSHGWATPSSKMPSWIAMLEKWRSTVWITYFSNFAYCWYCSFYWWSSQYQSGISSSKYHFVDPLNELRNFNTF